VAGDRGADLVISPRCATAAVLLTAALVAGTWIDRPVRNPPLRLGGYRVLAVDFHTHSSMWSDGALTPWGLVSEARRQGLDAIAVTAHNETWDAHVAARFSRATGGDPIVLVGEEIVRPTSHMVAAGLSSTVNFLQRASAAIDDVHRQGGIAIAAHPGIDFWEGFDGPAMQRLDGTEICHPAVFVRASAQRDLEEFAARAPMAAIGSSDFHGFGPMGICRTYVFASAATGAAILDAVRARRTVTFARDDHAYGDPALVQLAAAAGNFRDREPWRRPVTTAEAISRLCGVLGLAVLAGLRLPGAARLRRGR
jgi:hypothetical protein